MKSRFFARVIMGLGVSAIGQIYTHELVLITDDLFIPGVGALEEEPLFAERDPAVDESPKLAMGPVLRMVALDKGRKDTSTAIVPALTFKAAAKGCDFYAIAPTQEAIEDKIEIQFVRSTRLPDNYKWEPKHETDVFSSKLDFDRPVTLEYTDAGYSSTDGSWTAYDTNKTWVVRLFRNNKALTNPLDYQKYIRHLVSSNSPSLVSDILMPETEYLIKWGLAGQDFKTKVIDPIREQVAQASAETGGVPQPGSASGAEPSLPFCGKVLYAAKYVVSFVAGFARNVRGVVSYIAKRPDRCSSSKSSIMTSDLRHQVILASY